MTDEQAILAAVRALPPELAGWASERLWATLPLARRRAQRDQLLRRAAGLLYGPPWTRARALAQLARAARRAVQVVPDLSTPAGCVAAALIAYPGRRDRTISPSQVYRVLSTSIDPVEMQEAPVGKSSGTEEHTTMTTQYRIEAGEDAREKFIRGAAASIYERAGHKRTLAAAAKHPDLGDHFANVSLDPGEFREATLSDLAREALARQGVPTARLHGEALVKRALEYRTGGNTSSDFTILLETVVNKIFLGRYALTPVSWRRWCGIKPVQDFRAATFYRPGSFGKLDAISESGEIKYKNIPDGAKAAMTPATKGNIIGLSRRAIVNDDLGAFRDLAGALGEAAALTIESDAFALITPNSGLGPTQSDGQPLFHSNRSNIGASGAMTATTIDTSRAVMGKQKDVSANQFLELRPAIWLGPTELGGQARVLNNAMYEPTANKFQVPNVVAGLFRDVVDSAYLSAVSATRHYLLADPDVYPVFAVGFINGNEAPKIESQQSFGFDGMQMRVILDYGTAVLDYRGAVTAPGA